MLKRSMVQDSLAPRFDGPYTVIRRKGPNVKLRLATRDKWVHLNHCKEYVGEQPAVVQVRRGSGEDNPMDGGHIARGENSHNEQPELGSSHEESTYESDSEYPNGVTDLNERESSTEDGAETGGTSTDLRRYPARTRRRPTHLSDYTT